MYCGVVIAVLSSVMDVCERVHGLRSWSATWS